MPRPESIFDGAEGDILIEIYEGPGDPFSSHTLTQRLNPNLQTTTPEYHAAFAHICSVIEKLIVRRLIRGKRLKSADGVFFENLKLTDKGEIAAIEERERRVLPGQVKQLMDVVEAWRERKAERQAELQAELRQRLNSPNTAQSASHLRSNGGPDVVELIKERRQGAGS